MTTSIEWHVRGSDDEMHCIYTVEWLGVGAEIDDDQVFRVIRALRESPAPTPRPPWWRRLMFWRKS